MSDDYEVGFKKPPKHTQFKRGQSGNPKGRPKGSRNFSSDVKHTLKEPVRLNKDGKRKTVSTQHAALLRLREKALSGDARALDRLLNLAGIYNDEDMAEAAAGLAPADAEVLEGFKERVLRQAEKAQPDSEDKAENGAVTGADLGQESDNALEDDDYAFLR